MRKLVMLFSIVASFVFMSFVSSVAAENSYNEYEYGGTASELKGQGNPAQKDECLLVAMNCADSVDTISERISRLTHEIDKGTAVYTPNELELLKRELNDARSTLRNLYKR